MKGRVPQWNWRGPALAALLGVAAQTAAAQDWVDLSPTQRRALTPLQAGWATLPGNERTMWLELADRWRGMSPEDQQRAQQRMRDWSAMTPEARGRARLQYQEAGRWSAESRRERWEAYQSLDPQARRVLAERWKLEAAGRDRAAAPESPGKRNMLEPVRPAPEPTRAATPTAAAARAGATTRPLARSGDEAPAYQQPGVPKIAATPSFVDPATLQPRRGPQAASVAPKPASAPKPGSKAAQ
ncbi:MAG: DUF3106 domain-containing protein [Burkholderiaceae bacterium]|nr:DUF3106 domain-containing protein [Rhodoferax sp.]MCP5286986.1 DUF3106 domain-containing protein [Burkholderiaceae bacterium]